ncbi:MAG: ABC transporter ATP-binding protein [Armatimonadetes bacterium]|nr:ABC transporter ATP-binding protein [Armatimonadota bacterium]
MAVAEISSLTLKYGSKVAVSDLSCTVPEGCVGLLGPNGAGKTTLIKALMGFLTPASGGATVLGYDIRTEGLKVRMHVGLMPEQECHIPGLSAVQYVAYAGELCGMPSADAMRRAHEVLDYCGLSEARYRPIETYSTGMKQKAKLAQALVHGPQLLFLDEPTNGLDPQARDEVLTMIRDISHGKGVNCILSSHLLPDIERTCDHVIVMQHGTVRAQDSVEGIRSLSMRQWDVELREPSEEFEREVAAAGAEVVWSVLNRYRVEFPDGTSDASHTLFLAARNASAQVRSIRHSQRTLEDAFLEAIE